MIDKPNKKSSCAYIPPNADTNYENKPKDPPKTEYEKRRVALRREEVKKLTKGKYGRE